LKKALAFFAGRRELRFRFVDAQRGEFRIGTMCEVLGVSRSGYYAWRRRPRSLREQGNATLLATIRRLHPESRGIYGSPRIYAALLQRGIACGRHHVARLMREEGIRSKTKRRFRYIATKRDEMPSAPNRRAASPRRPRTACGRPTSRS